MRDHTAQRELLRTIREEEASLVAQYLPKSGRLLEVGAGSGYQALYFEKIGFQVSVIDIQSSRHLKNAIFPVQVYDGTEIPFPDQVFDAVFSSNVLEHVPECVKLLAEMSRVLKDEGLMIHTLPTPAWRFWTSLAHYPWVLQQVVSPTQRKERARPVGESVEPQAKKSALHLLRAGMLPARHGVRGNWFTEMYYFSRFYWNKVFDKAQLDVQAIENNGLFYTGYGIPGAAFPMDKRSRLASWLGSACVFFVLKKQLTRRKTSDRGLKSQ